MQKVVKKLTSENNLDFDKIYSFETESYIGIFNYNNCNYVMFEKSGREFRMYELLNCKDLDELDMKTYKTVGEHIIGVSNSSKYTFKIHEEE